MKLKWLAAIVVGGLVCIFDSQLPARQVPVFRSRADLVSLDVRVVDNSGRSIVDLKPEEFRIVEGGRQQKIISAEVVHLSKGSEPSRPKGQVSFEVLTNAPERDSGRGFVVVIDDMHIIESELLHVKRILQEFIAGLAPGDQAAIVFVGHSDLSQNFTSDRQRLLGVADRLRGAFGFGLDALGQTANSGLTANPRYMFEMARRTDGVLENIAAALEGSQFSRKAILLITAGSVLPTVPTLGSPYESDHQFLKAALDAAVKVGAPVYAIDPRGLVQPADAIRGGVGSIGNVGEGADQATRQRSRIVGNIKRQQVRLGEIASWTGGQAFTNQSDLSKAVAAFLADNNDYYVLRYYPDSDAQGDRFRAVKVETTRPGLTVRAPSGYSSPASSDDGTPVAQVRAAIKAGVNSSGLSLVAEALTTTSIGKTRRVSVHARVSYPDQQLAATTDELHWLLAAFDPEGKLVATAEHSSPTNDKNGQLGVITDSIEIPNSKVILRLGVVSRSLRRAGSIQMDIDEASIDKNSVRLDAISIGTGEGVLSGGQIEMARFRPNLSRAFAASAKVVLVGYLRWSTSARPTVSVSVLGSAVKGNAQFPSQAPESGQGQSAFAVELPLDGMKAGRHDLEVIVANAGREVTKGVVHLLIH